MPTSKYRECYIGELYVTEPPEGAAARAQRGAAELMSEGHAIRYLRTLSVPDDELCLHVFAAESAELVGDLGCRSGTPFDRVLSAIEITSTESEGRSQ
jgi:hypothetical protein